MATTDAWTLEHLRLHLQAAVELELLVIPPYLSALYSIHPGTNREASAIVQSVVVEEMLHVTLAANLLNAVGGRPTVTDPEWIPRYPAKLPFHGGAFAVSLRPLGHAALDTFLTIENPSYAGAHLAAPPEGAAVPRLLTLPAPNPGGYPTVGAFYTAIEHGLKALVEHLGPSRVFTGDRALQAEREHYYGAGGHVVQVTDLATALDALDQVIEQGEGDVTLPPSGERFDPERDLAHFYRVLELRQGRRYRARDRPEQPTGPPLDLDLAAVYPVKVDLRLAEIPGGSVRRCAEACAGIWTRLLEQVDAGISGHPEALPDAIVTMFDLKHAAGELVRVPLPGGDGCHAGPTFEYLPADC
jgi:hypothetical protein